jgi:hypothetical protein
MSKSTERTFSEFLTMMIEPELKQTLTDQARELSLPVSALAHVHQEGCPSRTAIKIIEPSDSFQPI